MLTLEKSKLFINSTYVSENIAYGSDSTTLRVGEQSDLQLYGSVFKNNRASVGGAIFASDHSMVNITGVIFENLESTIRAGALFAENECTILVKYCRFYKNRSRDKAAIIMTENVYSIPMEIRNSVFEENEAAENIIELVYSQAFFD